MKPDDILDAFGNVDDEYIKKARQKSDYGTKTWKTVISIAACLCIVLASVLFLRSYVKPETGTETTFAGISAVNSESSASVTENNVYSEILTEKVTAENPAGVTEKESALYQTQSQFFCLTADTRERKEINYMVENSARVWPWNCREIFDKFQGLEFNGTDYRTRAAYYGTDIPKDMIGKKLGSTTSRGYDIYEEKSHSIQCDIYEIRGVDSQRFIAVRYQGYDGYYPFIRSDFSPPETLGDLIDSLNLTETFPFSSFYYGQGGKDAHYLISGAANDVLWSFFLKYAGAKTEDYDSVAAGEKTVSFPINSVQLGAVNLSWTLYDNGYLKTNIENYGYAYYIGTDAVKEITEYALNHKAGTTGNNKQIIIGRVTEIGEDYIKIDDTMMMKNPSDGMEITVKANNMRIKRYIISGFLKVGQTVAVTHEGLLMGDPTLIVTATNLEEITISGIDYYIAE
ncbi:MAG: hypothetical protein IJE74_04785 [Clostridia bacterium]|nr:hypothetical protein [Clostridia bacterium]